MTARTQYKRALLKPLVLAGVVALVAVAGALIWQVQDPAPRASP